MLSHTANIPPKVETSLGTRRQSYFCGNSTLSFVAEAVKKIVLEEALPNVVLDVNNDNSKNGDNGSS